MAYARLDWTSLGLRSIALLMTRCRVNLDRGVVDRYVLVQLRRSLLQHTLVLGSFGHNQMHRQRFFRCAHAPAVEIVHGRHARNTG